mmetsp:Transcript_14269/g.28473  ORF Transcript_14269/g.28473 Transcript_14269/m.28473 type:complete len:224 (-) Transcript_14269:114-785(-)
MKQIPPQLPPGTVLKEDGVTVVYPSTRRPDGTWRKERVVRKIKPTAPPSAVDDPPQYYIPQEEMGRFIVGGRRRNVSDRSNRVPGMESTTTSKTTAPATATARKNARRRAARVAARENDGKEDIVGDNITLAEIPDAGVEHPVEVCELETETTSPSPSLSKQEYEKKARSIRKKLRRIDGLKKETAVKNLDALNDDQQAMLSSEEVLCRELDAIQNMLDEIAL